MASLQTTAQSGERISCKYCSDSKLDTLQEFTRHTLEHHCVQEANSFVCCYGDGGLCLSMPLNSLTEKEYEKHVSQYHINNQGIAKSSNATTSTNTKTSGNVSFVPMSHNSFKVNSIQRINGSETPVETNKWTVYSGSQNLPAVLNDPNRGKQKDFFTKLWGDTFVEKTDIPPPSYLPEITRVHFESYLRKIGKRYRKHERMKASAPAPIGHTQVLHTFPNLRVPSLRHVDKLKYDIDTIPSTFLQSAFDLSNLETFNAVYNLGQSEEHPDTHKSISAIMGHSGKILQEKLTQYLDTVEVQISHQVAHKSDAFFLAMRSHDALMEQMTDTISVVKTLRENIHLLDKGLVQESLRLLKLKRARSNYVRVYQKLKLMSSVHQTQPMIQLLLSTPDYVAALDLIQTSQEMSQQKLPGIHSFRHLGPQLLEMGRLIDKMLSTEFERYATADLNRPLGADTGVLEGDKLVSIILGLLRQKKFDFIDAYKAEAFTTIKAVVKQSVIEVLASSEAAPCEGDMSLTEQMHVLTLTLPEWCKLFQQCTETLTRLVLRVKAAADIMRDAAKVSAGLNCTSEEMSQTENGSPSLHVSVCEPPEVFLNSDELTRVCSKLDELLCAVCDSAHERCANLLTSQQSTKYSAESRDVGPSVSPSASSASSTSSSSGTTTLNTSFSSSNGCFPGNSSGWLVERATAAQVCLLSQIVEDFCTCCQQVCGRQSAILRTAFKMQANKFVVRFHHERKTKLDLILNSERWKQADVPAEFQALVDKIHQSGEFGTPRVEAHPELEGQPPSDKLRVGDDQFAVVGTVLILIRIVAEYCGCASDLPLCAGGLCRSVAELIALFNSRCCQLVLGAKAVQSAGLQTITTTNLALASRALQLLLWLIPKVKAHFTALFTSSANNPGVPMGTGNVAFLTHIDNAEKDVCSHIEEIEAKVLMIMSTSIENLLSNWDARPPVPSQSFRNVTKHLSKLHKAVGTILPANQIRELYRAVHVSFKDKLRESLPRNRVVNDGGPQHGVVTAELTFYLEALKSLKVLPVEEVNEQSLEDLWR